MDQLEEYREQIDTVNREIAEKIAERMEIVEKVGEYKEENNMEIKDEGREEVVKQQFEDIFGEKGLPQKKGRELAEMLIGMAVKEEEEVKEQ
ncbi:MAG: chorismate mutase [Candidatus Nanohalobium sp.]